MDTEIYYKKKQREKNNSLNRKLRALPVMKIWLFGLTETPATITSLASATTSTLSRFPVSSVFLVNSTSSANLGIENNCVKDPSP